MDETTTPDEPFDAPEEGAPDPSVPEVPSADDAASETEVHWPPDLVWQRPPRAPLGRGQRIALVVLLLSAAGMYFARLGEPSRLLTSKDARKQCRDMPTYHSRQCWELIPLDEVHYVPDARDVLRFGSESDTRVPPAHSQFVVHPPVAKWFIAIGIWIFGDKPFGWRFFGAVFGVWGVFVMFMLGRRLWRSAWWALAAAGLLAIDGLWFVQSRVAMLDIYAASFFLTGFWMLAEDRDRTSPDHRGKRWWRIGAAVMFGFAAASKYPVETGLFVIVAIVTSWIWDARKAPLAREPRPFRKRFIAAIGTFVIIPAAIYVGSYGPWFFDAHRYNPPRCVEVEAPAFTRAVGLRSVTTVVEKWGCYQSEILDFHRHLAKYQAVAASPSASASPSPAATGTPEKISEPAHPYFGNAYSWPWIGRPVAHYYTTTGEGKKERDREVIGIPNPIVWWSGFFIALPLLLWWAIRRRDDLATILLAFFLAGWLPYVLADAVKRPVFLFYATPLVPFVVMSVVHVLYRAWWRWGGARVIAGVFIGLAVVVFAYFYPILSGLPIPHDGLIGWNGHMWFAHDCTVAHAIKVLCWI